MPVIWSLRPNVTREQAIGQFRGRGLSWLLRSARGPLHSVAALYIPFGVFRVNINTGRKQQTSTFALDLVRGDFDPYQLANVGLDDTLVQVETRNRPAPALTENAAREAVIARARRLVFSRGFFRVQKLTITAEPLRMDVHVPYWVGVWRRSDSAEIAVLDAVRRRPEGAKVRNFVRAWLGDSQ
jgi:hypothetical protein